MGKFEDLWYWSILLFFSPVLIYGTQLPTIYDKQITLNIVESSA